MEIESESLEDIELGIHFVNDTLEKIEIAFAIAPRFAFFKSEVISKYDYLLFLQ